MNLVQRLSYKPSVIRAARALGLRHILRKWYHRWARPHDGVLRLTVGGIDVQFCVRTPEELRLLESAGGAGGEQRVLELLLSALRAGDVVFDVGANVGLYTVLLAKAVGDQGRVISFEPEEKTFVHLQDNLTLNRLTNVTCFRKALGSQSGQVKLYSSDVIGNSSLVGSESTHGSAQVVDLVEGDRLIASERLPLPCLVKIDVEGYEYAVIQGMSRTLAQPACELVCCEVHPALLPTEVKPGQISMLLGSLGFRHSDTYTRWDGTFHLVARKTGGAHL